MAKIKEGMNEIPEVVLAGVAAGISTIAAVGLYVFGDPEKKINPPYKMRPIYMRPDDPRAARVPKP